jgi:carbon storage regulator
MLVLSRKLGEVIYVGDNVKITVVDIDWHKKKIRLGFEAPREVSIMREEVLNPPPMQPSTSDVAPTPTDS